MFTKSKIFIYFLVLVTIALYFFLKPLTVFYLEKTLTKSLKRPVEITNVVFYPLSIDAIITIETFPEGVNVHAKYVGGLSIKPKSIGKVIITSNSMGGLVTIDYEHHTYNGVAKDLDFQKVAKVLGDRKFIKSGKVNGTFVYYKKKRLGSTDFILSDSVLNDVTINKQVNRVNDALNLNVLSLMSQGVDKAQKKSLGDSTKIDYGTFNITYKDNNIIADDVALRTKNYRIMLEANIHKKGKINHFNTYLLDDKGCAMVKQKYQGTIQRPKLYKTTPMYKHVVQTAPTSMFDMGKEMMGFGQAMAVQQGFKQKDMQMSNYMMNESGYMIKNGSKIVMPKDCPVIYDGLVKHPSGNQIDLEKTSKSHRLML